MICVVYCLVWCLDSLFNVLSAMENTCFSKMGNGINELSYIDISFKIYSIVICLLLWNVKKNICTLFSIQDNLFNLSKCPSESIWSFLNQNLNMFPFVYVKNTNSSSIYCFIHSTNIYLAPAVYHVSGSRH